LPGLRPFDVHKEIVEEAKFIGIHIIQKVELHKVTARMLKQACLRKVHHCGEGGTLQTDELLCEFQEILTEFQDIFSEPTFANSQNRRQASFEIRTDPNGQIPFRSPYTISPREEAGLRRQIEQEIRSCWIQPSQSNFGSPVLFMPKPDGTLRMCIDSRAVCPITIKHRSPLPHIEDLLNFMHGSYWFTKVALAAGYDQIRIATADWQITAFTTKFGLYEWRVLLFGLANAPSQFMHIMNGILEPVKCKFIAIYLDHIVIHSRTRADHVVHVREVLTYLTEHGVKSKFAKYTWACQKVEFCGFDIIKYTIHAQEHKTRAVMDWPLPENSQHVSGFLGLTSYYRKFIEHYPHIAMPLNVIGTPPIENGDVGQQCGEPKRVRHTPFAWDGECQHAFHTLNIPRSNTLGLALPYLKAKYCLHVDASPYALGAVLSKVQNKTEKVVGYLAVGYTMRRSNTLHTTENYWASEMQYYSGNSTYTERSSHLWYTRTTQPFVVSSHNHTSPYVRWIS